MRLLTEEALLVCDHELGTVRLAAQQWLVRTWDTVLAAYAAEVAQWSKGSKGSKGSSP